MTDATASDVSPKFEELLQSVPPAEWVREMIEHYRRHGSFRPEDLRRLLGDPKTGVVVPNQNSLPTSLKQFGH
jgi:hypothetical protein